MSIKWKRACAGLYVDPSERWVVNNEERGWYSIRAFLGWGPLPDGTTMFPDYGSIWHGDYRTLAEAKAVVEQMVLNGETPALEPGDRYRLENNLARADAGRC